MKATSSAYRPIASTSAKPIHIKAATRAWIDGLRPIVAMVVANTLPMPTPTPPSPMAARPAPIICAASVSIQQFLLVARMIEVGFAAAKLRPWVSVQVHGILEVDTAEHREHVRLEKRNRQLEPGQPDRQGERREA